jgi:hypothetical protein
MKIDRTCKHCDQLFKDIEGKVFANHVRWCDKNKTNGDKGSSKLAEAGKKRFDEKLGGKKTFTMQCQRCDKSFDVVEREKKHPERDVYFCSRECANSRGPRSEDFKDKVRKWSRQNTESRLTEFLLTHDENAVIHNNQIFITKSCLVCSKQFKHKHKRPMKTCSRTCSNRLKSTVEKGSLTEYRRLCTFKFSLNDYPDEFDFSLIEKHGWYAAKNHGDNLYGVSRDHIVSVRFGFDNQIDPKIISHPANCQLLRHNENVSKHKKCAMTINELLEKIQKWDDRYKQMGT